MSTDDSSFEKIYQGNNQRYQQLKEEVEFILNDIAQRTEVKIHSISGRVKGLNSVLEKIQRKGYSKPAQELEDIVGCRIVCLFISDLAKIEKAIMDEFKVRKSEDKVEGGGDSATFGYMSKHYICQLGATHSGPRYNNLKDVTFEIQCRTLLMDAWANVSHYLAYKGTVSIPAHLRRDFFALSGLFYVADKHFELFLNEAINSEQEAISKANSGELIDDDDDINLETIRALFAELYPERREPRRIDISQFAEEAVDAGYTKVSQLRKDLNRAADVVIQLERDHPPAEYSGSRTIFNQVGIARQALGILGTDNSNRHWRHYRKYLKST